MDRRYYSKRHFQLLANGGPDTPETIRERRIAGEANRLGAADREAKFPTLTPGNAAEAIAYQEERIRAHYQRLITGSPR